MMVYNDYLTLNKNLLKILDRDRDYKLILVLDDENY
jgi:hypothetical protein